MLPAEFPLYFCGLPFTARQVGKKLRWLLAGQEIREVIRGVYVDIRVPDSLELRAKAVALLVPADGVACGRTAAWVHGIATTALGTEQRMDVRWTRNPTDVIELFGLRLSSPTATTVELAMELPRPFALSAVDSMLRSGIDKAAVRTASEAYARRPGFYQARQILSYADRRAASPGESWLRLRLIDAGFGQPDLQVRVQGKRRDYVLDLGYPEPLDDGRRLGLEYDSDRWHSGSRQEARDEQRRTELAELGWHIISVRRPDLWGAYPALELAVGGYLCRQPRLPRRW
ncbi:hypothetical protein [Kribbella monticola]|uniref:hypothetical protein n=1 Tax=Kribbella monticola TaxID=2185285 RepID=UPI000DD41CB2|nr:hypothetical protein [Kribbella monticola]